MAYYGRQPHTALIFLLGLLLVWHENAPLPPVLELEGDGLLEGCRAAERATGFQDGCLSPKPSVV